MFEKGLRIAKFTDHVVNVQGTEVIELAREVRSESAGYPHRFALTRFSCALSKIVKRISYHTALFCFRDPNYWKICHTCGSHRYSRDHLVAHSNVFWFIENLHEDTKNISSRTGTKLPRR